MSTLNKELENVKNKNNELVEKNDNCRQKIIKLENKRKFKYKTIDTKKILE